MAGNMNGQERELVFLLLGNNPTLPYSECESILESNSVPFKEIKRLDQVLIISAPVDACRVVARQAGLVRRACILLTQCEKTPESILQAIDKLDLKEVLGPQVSFAVRVKGVKGHSKGLNITELERGIGAQVREKAKWARVDLENPDVLFYIIITDDRALFCLSIEEVEERGFGQRRPWSRPFFHPSSMHPRLARTMVNLSGAKLGSRFLDPFCGSGGILLEAGFIGCKLIGVDIDPIMSRGSKENLQVLGLRSANIFVGDARQIPLKEIDSVATDPPYGRSSSTKGNNTFMLVEESLEEMASILKSQGKICISIPSELNLKKLRPKGLKLVEIHPFRVHRSLTRNVVTFVRIQPERD
jgi:tRNA (guanine10-N2)-dimethyltransferase